MIELRRGVDRPCTRTGWLTSRHSFSYGQWYDAANVGFGPLVVSNHDVLAPGAGFEEHEHAGVDLVTYVVDGALEHRDSTGHSAVLGPGELQLLRAGGGVRHSERNASATEPVEYVQMWLTSDAAGSSYERVPVVELPAGRLEVLDLRPGQTLTVGPGAHVYLVTGELTAPGLGLIGGDALRVRRSTVGLLAQARSTVLAWTVRMG